MEYSSIQNRLVQKETKETFARTQKSWNAERKVIKRTQRKRRK